MDKPIYSNWQKSEIEKNLQVMKLWVTELKAIHPTKGILTNYMGPYIEADSLELAEKHCEENGLGYCKVIGELDSELDYNTATEIKNFSEKLKHK